MVMALVRLVVVVMVVLRLRLRLILQMAGDGDQGVDIRRVDVVDIEEFRRGFSFMLMVLLRRRRR